MTEKEATRKAKELLGKDRCTPALVYMVALGFLRLEEDVRKLIYVELAKRMLA